ncbi:hypothetical protein R1sor_026773 [Riccia sorocarpa]|uniref:FCP1 homology domain-containing protein n=1 Tax=Riccia sorocarpa TaxID=122646 RepID=A0ABD3GFN8_9MARC
MELFWDVRLGMVDDHISTSQIVRTGLAVTDTNCSLTAKDIYVRLGRLEEKVQLEKSKRKADGAGPSNLKKARTADVDIVEQFKSIVTQTMGRKSHKEVIALVCCSDETFAAFEKFVKKWELGKIPDVQGNTNLVPNDKGVEQKRDFSQLSVNRFRPVNGLNDEDLRYREVYDTWDELAAEYPFPPNWLDSMIKRKRKSKKKVYIAEPLPSQVVTALHRVYQAKRGEYSPERLEPIEVLHVKDISKYQLRLDEKLDCQLVYLDLTHSFMVTWEKQEFSNFLSIVRDLTVAKHFTIVSVMEFGQTLVDFTSALKEMKDARVSFEYGCYEGPRVHKRSAMSYPCWQLMYMFVSLDAEDYKPVLVDDVTKRPFLIEYEPDSWLYEKDVVERDDADNIKFRIPRWSFVDMTLPDESATYVHPVSKRGGFCNKMIINFSTEGSSVFDFFSGGIFAREALLNGRDVVYFASSAVELEFIKKYAKALLLHSERVKQWFTRYSSSKGNGSNRQILAAAGGGQRAHAAGVVVVDEALMGDAIARLGEKEFPQIQFEPEPDGEVAEQEVDGEVVEQEADGEVAEKAPAGPPPSPAPDQGTSVQATVSGPQDQLVGNVEIQAVADIEMPQAEAPDSITPAEGNIEGEILVPKELGAVAQNHKPDDQEAGQHEVVPEAVVTQNLCIDNQLTLLRHLELRKKFMFVWDQNNALDTKKTWSRGGGQFQVLLKPLKTIWETMPGFNARNTLLIDVNPYRASANPQDTSIFPSPFTGSSTDTYLTSVLLPYLESVSQAFDVREYVRDHTLQGGLRPLHFRSTSRGLAGLLHSFTSQAVETYVPQLLNKRKKLTDFEIDILKQLPRVAELTDRECVAWARLLGLPWNQNLQDDLTTVGLSKEIGVNQPVKLSVKLAREFLTEVLIMHFP